MFVCALFFVSPLLCPFVCPFLVCVPVVAPVFVPASVPASGARKTGPETKARNAPETRPGKRGKNEATARHKRGQEYKAKQRGKKRAGKRGKKRSQECIRGVPQRAIRSPLLAVSRNMVRSLHVSLCIHGCAKMQWLYERSWERRQALCSVPRCFPLLCPLVPCVQKRGKMRGQGHEVRNTRQKTRQQRGQENEAKKRSQEHEAKKDTKRGKPRR